MRIALLIVAVVAPLVACSQGPDSDRDPSSSTASSRLGADGGASGSIPGVPSIPGLPQIDAGACCPTVQASAASCSVTIDTTTCDCTDAACIEGALQQCLTANLPSLPGAGGGVLGDAGLGGGCSQADIDAAKKQFCDDVDTAAKKAGLSATLDCNAIGQLPTGFTPPSSLPAGGVACGDHTQAAAATAAQTLSACLPTAFLSWDPSARLQLFSDGACMLP